MPSSSPAAQGTAHGTERAAAQMARSAFFIYRRLRAQFVARSSTTPRIPEPRNLLFVAGLLFQQLGARLEGVFQLGLRDEQDMRGELLLARVVPRRGERYVVVLAHEPSDFDGVGGAVERRRVDEGRPVEAAHLRI